MALSATPGIRPSSTRVQVTFKDELDRLHNARNFHPRLAHGGPYDEAVDLTVSPLAPGESKPFRLTFENISAQWNHAYPNSDHAGRHKIKIVDGNRHGQLASPSPPLLFAIHLSSRFQKIKRQCSPSNISS